MLALVTRTHSLLQPSSFMQPSRSTSTDVAVEQASMETLLAAVDQLGRDAASNEVAEEEAYYRDLFRLLLREGPFEAVAVWAIADSGPVLKACAPASAHFSPLPGHLLGRLLSNESLEFRDADASKNGSSPAAAPRAIAGARIQGSEGVALEVASKTAAHSGRSLRLLEALAELISHVDTRFRYRAARRRDRAAHDVERVVRSFHQGRSLNETALLIAAGFQETLGDDRAWVCRTGEGTTRVLASSAPGDVARRQLLVRRVEEVARAALATGSPIAWSAGETAGPAGEAVLALAEEGKARRVTVALLTPPDARKAAGLVVLERFSDVSTPDEPARREMLVPHASLALARALEDERRGWKNRLVGESGVWWKRGVALAAIAGTILFLAAPIPLEVEASGQLLPATVRSVFAPADGVVEAMYVHHAQTVNAGTTLLDIRSPELDLERERVAGQISELNARLAAIQVLRTQGRPAGPEAGGDLSAQEEQVHVALKGAMEQRRLIQEQSARLTLRSPIAGVVDRWDLDEALAARPVVRGQHLCDILDVAGPWKLDLRIPDQSAARVFAARSAAGGLPVRFVVRTEPRTEHITTLSRVGERTEVDEAGQLFLRGTAAVTSDLPVARRAGASVLARIDCGRRSRAFVWFHDLWDFVALKFL